MLMPKSVLAPPLVQLLKLLPVTVFAEVPVERPSVLVIPVIAVAPVTVILENTLSV